MNVRVLEREALPARGHEVLRRIALVGNSLPRRCGIATFTSHLYEALTREVPELRALVVPVNDGPGGYDYPSEVRFEIQEHDLHSYRSAADFLNINKIDLVCLQHEFGIFGGVAGSHVLALLRDLRTPVLTTLHTVQRDPQPAYRRVLEEVVRLSDRVVVMSRTGARFLREVYGVPGEKIDVIPHGMPDMPFADPNFHKDRFGVEGKQVLLTFGLLSPNKGIEYVIRALPAIVERHRRVVYMVLGATHPNVVRQQGESYRLSLERLARSLGVEEHVVFLNRFVSEEELVECIGAADIYITPYLSRDQIISGTLTYAVGAGKAVVSTPYWYAQELLADGRGVLVPFADAGAVADAVTRLLENEAERHAMRKRAYLFSREMVWPAVARRYVQAMARAVAERARRPRPVPAFEGGVQGQRELPRVDLRHLQRLTEDAGILQHAVFIAPNYDEGYTTDDNARALVVAVMLEELGMADEVSAVDLAARYLAFLWHAFDQETRRFRNHLSYDRRWLEEVGSEDAHGRALWALGAVLGRSATEGLRGTAARLFEMALPVVLEMRSLRAWAFTLVGLGDYFRRFAGDRAARHVQATLAHRLLEAYRAHGGEDWRWFEDVLTYANAKLPHALLVAGRWMGNDEMWRAGLEALDWLAAVQRGEDGQFVPIGTDGFYRRGGARARFDQQPLEAQAMVSACLEAFRLTGERKWWEEAWRAFDWFLGRNDLGVPLYDPTTGGCRDGLHPDRVNQNQGAESTLAFLQALLELRLTEQVIDPADVKVAPRVPDRDAPRAQRWLRRAREPAGTA